MNYFLVDSSNIVKNVIEYDGVSSYTPTEGLILKRSSNPFNIGDTFTE